MLPNEKWDHIVSNSLHLASGAFRFNQIDWEKRITKVGDAIEVPYNGKIWRVLYLANEPFERIGVF